MNRPSEATRTRWGRLRVWLAATGAVLVTTAGMLAMYVRVTWDRAWDAPLPDIHATSNPDVIRRGEYLVYGPAHCVECHRQPSAEEPGEDGARPALSGGERFATAPLGAVYAKNLTPDFETGIGRYTDAEIARVLRYSVRPNGRAIVQLLMPFGNLSDADLTAIVSFLRSQAPIRNRVPDNEVTWIGKIVKSVSPLFKPRVGVAAPAESPEEQPTIERGAYIARSVGNCITCHTRFDPVTFKRGGSEFAGGNELAPSRRVGADPAVWFRTPNLTPAPGGALDRFPDRATFVARFQRGGRHYPGSPMPWESFGLMSAADAGAVYEYLHSLAPAPGPTGEPTFVRK